MCHFDCPMGLVNKYGTWRSREMVTFFERYVHTIVTRYKGLVKYWLTFNEINNVFHAPFMAVGVNIRPDEDDMQVKYQAAHHLLIASATATKVANEIDPEAQIGCMMCGGVCYPYSCRPEDYWAAMMVDRKELFFIDVQARDYYHNYVKADHEKYGIVVSEEDKALLKAYPVDFISFS